MYAGRVACCFLLSHGECADGTDRRTDVRPLHDAFRYKRGHCNDKFNFCMQTDRQWAAEAGWKHLYNKL